MSTVFITQPNAVLKIDNGRLLVTHPEGGRHVILLHRLEQVVVAGPAMLTTAVIDQLGKAGVDLVFLSYSGRYVGRIDSSLSKNVFLRKRQYRLSEDEKFCLSLSASIVRNKIQIMRTFAQRIRREQTLSSEYDITDRMDAAVRSIDQANSPDSLRGVEGSATRSYFSVLSKGIDDVNYHFTGRSRQPPRDPANALLSFGYAVLMNAVHADVMHSGLDPYCGVLHSDSYGRPSLALDLMEEFRPLVIDPCVLKVFNLKMLNSSHFREHEEAGVKGIWLSPEGIKTYIGVIQKRLMEEFFHQDLKRRMPLRKIIFEHVHAFRDVVIGVKQNLLDMGWK